MRHEHRHGEFPRREANIFFKVAVAMRLGWQARAGDTHHGADAVLYHEANALVTHNLGVRYGVANGTRGIVAGWKFHPNAALEDFCYHGVQAFLPSAPVECVYVQVANVRLNKREPSQPSPFLWSVWNFAGWNG